LLTTVGEQVGCLISLAEVPDLMLTPSSRGR
jgi:hypothetical protein